MFSIVGFCVGKILGTVGSQIETKRIFSFAKFFTSFRRCLQSENLDNFIFVNKNWPYDPRISCKSPFSLVDFIENDLNLEEKFEEFEGAFERVEVVEL
jgi:hypothetical protein